MELIEAARSALIELMDCASPDHKSRAGKLGQIIAMALDAHKDLTLAVKEARMHLEVGTERAGERQKIAKEMGLLNDRASAVSTKMRK